MIQTSALPQQIAVPIMTASTARSQPLPTRCAELAAMPLSALLYRVLIAEQTASA